MSGKYWEKYKENKVKLERTCKTPTHMSDKQAYITSLESHLEKYNHSHILVSTFSDRIDQLQKQLNTSEERIANLTRLFKLQNSETSENPHGGIFLKLEERVCALESAQKSKVDSFKNFSGSVDSALKDTEKRIAKLIEDFEDKCRKSSGVYSFGANELVEGFTKEKERLVREAAESAWLAQQTCNKLAEDTIDRVSGCEKRMRELRVLIENTSPNVEDIEMQVTARLDTSIENLSVLIKGYIRSQDLLAAEVREFKEREGENKDPGVFSFGNNTVRTQEVGENKMKERVKLENTAREVNKEHSKEKELKSTRKRSTSPGIKVPVEKKSASKKDENKVKKKIDRKNKLEKLYQNFSEKNS